MYQDDDSSYEKVKKSLKELPKVNAPANFESELTRRIKLDVGIKENKSWFDKIFSPQLIPSAALAVTAAIIFLLLKPQIDQTGKIHEVGRPLREEKQNEKFILQPETKKESIHLEDMQKINDKSFEVKSESQFGGEKSPEGITSPMQAPAQEPSGDKMKIVTPESNSEMKADRVSEEGAKILDKVETEPKAIKMSKEKVDTTKDSSKIRRKHNKF